MDDRSIRPRWTVLRLCESSRLQRQVPGVSEVEPLAQAYQQVFPQARRSLSDGNGTGESCRRPVLQFVTEARVAKGA
jgi:hypothetical protein